MDRNGSIERDPPIEGEEQQDSLLSKSLHEQLLEIQKDYLALPEQTREKLAGRFVAD